MAEAKNGAGRSSSRAGRSLLLGTNRSSGDAVSLDLTTLTRHVAMLGSTGSGKTVMAKALIEESTVSGVPSIIVDPQGDLARLILLGDRKELKSKGGDTLRQKRFAEQAEVRIWTPLREKGLPICIDPFSAPPDGLSDAEATDAWDLIATGFTNLALYDKEKAEGIQVHAYIFQLLVHSIRLGHDVHDFSALSRLLRGPHGILRTHLKQEVDCEWDEIAEEHELPDFEAMLPRGTREKLSRTLGAFTSGNRSLLFSNGVPLDIETLLEPSVSGKVPVNVIYLNTITDDAQRHAFLQEIGQWIDADGLDDDEFTKILDGNEDTTPANGFDVDELRRDVQHDLKLIIELRDLAREVNPDDDPKLHQLLDELRTVIKESEVEGGSPEQKRNRRKVLLFSYYEDTLRWVKEFLEAELGQDAVLNIFDGRLVSVAGSGDGHGVSREAAVFGFAPISSQAPASHSADKFDIMLTTDVLAEGQNLQQCRHIINYDLPWNPMRLVQRHGRIDRINSKHKDVWMRCFFPAEELELLLRLEERIQHKVAQAAASIGVENAPIPGGQEGEQVFDSHHNEIGKLHDEDATIFEEGGTDGHAYSGEEFRRELVKGVESYSLERILSLAWGSGCGLPTEEERGFVFCAKVGDEDRPDSIQLRFVPESLDTSEVSQRRLDCLRRISCTTDPDGFVDEELKSKVFDAWNIAQNDIHEEWTMATDPRNISPEVRPLFRKMGQWLLDNSPDGVDHDRLISAKNAIEAPWDRRRENYFRKLFKPDDCATPIERKALSRTLVENIEDLGLEAYPAPKPLIPIASEEVHLLAWVMLV